LVDLAKHNKNLTLIGPNAGVIGGNWGTWRLLHPVNDQTHSFMDLAFDSNAANPGAEGIQGHSLETESTSNTENSVCLGKMQLGNFIYFCKFLNTMERRSEDEF
jgi:hypothetical protein